MEMRIVCLMLLWMVFCLAVPGFRVRPIFRWYDFWIGMYVDRPKKRVYVFPIPMFGFFIEPCL